MMNFGSVAKSGQQTRDSLGSHPSIIPIPGIFRSEIKTWSEPKIIHDRDINNSWIAGSSTNAIVGTWTGTAGGGQLVVGNTTNTESLLRVKPVDDNWVNFLRATPTNTNNASSIGLLIDAETTGTINTSTFRIDLDKNETIAWIVAKGGSTVNKVTPFIDTSSERTNVDFGSGSDFPLTFPFTFGGGNLIEFSTDQGSSWDEVANGVELTLPSPGSEVWMRLTSFVDGKYWKTTNTSGEDLPLIVALVY